MVIEVIACSLADAVTAREAGADRVELCLAIEVGGLTPYIETVEQMRSLDPFPVVIMIRPHSGGFVNQGEHILQQIDSILSLNLPNIQFISGALTEDNELDFATMKAIRQRVGGKVLVCHRCFDLTPDPFVALEQLIDLGFDRVLTSGQAATALEGADIIAKLIEQAAGRIEIIAGSGVRPHNVQELIRRTGVTQIHASCFADATDPIGPVTYGPSLTVSAEKVEALVASSKAR